MVVTIGHRYCPETCGLVSQCKVVRDHFQAKQLASFGSDSNALGTKAAVVGDTTELVGSVDSADTAVPIEGEDEGEEEE